MLLLNHRTKIWTKITQYKKSRAGGTENKNQGHYIFQRLSTSWIPRSPSWLILLKELAKSVTITRYQGINHLL